MLQAGEIRGTDQILKKAEMSELNAQRLKLTY